MHSPIASPSVEVAPHLSERDARSLCAHVTAALAAHGMRPTQIGVHLDRDGFWWQATLGGRFATARTGQGNFTYQAVARDLVLAATDPDWNRLIVQEVS